MLRSILLYLMQDFTVIFRRRGGDDLERNHIQWAKTVRSSPDVIEMSFFPITELLDGVRGREHLARAIALYLDCKTFFASVAPDKCGGGFWSVTY